MDASKKTVMVRFGGTGCVFDLPTVILQSIEQVSPRVSLEQHRLMILTGALSFPHGIPELEWTSNPTKKLYLYHEGFPGHLERPFSRPELQVQCREYKVTKETVSEKSWIRGGRRVTLELPTYAIGMKETERKALLGSLNSFIESNVQQLLAGLSSGLDAFVSSLFAEAARRWKQVRFQIQRKKSSTDF